MDASKDSLRKFRYHIMDLLYAYPMTKYAADYAMNVAIIGTQDEIILETLKAVFSYGQAIYYNEDSNKYSYYGLQIKIFAPDGEAFETFYRQRMPGLTDSFQKEYAEISCHDANKLEGTQQLSEADGREEQSNSSQVKKKKFNCNYILICDPAFGSSISIFANRISGYSVGPDVLVAEFVDDADGFRVYGETEKGAFIDKGIREQLKQMNLNQKYVNILARDNCAPYSEAIKKQIDDYNKEDKYDYDSSYACTAHMPYKLAIFGTDRNEAVSRLAEILSLPEEEKRKDVIFKALIRLEHRRWNAYMIANGFEAPDSDLFKSKAYTEGYTHKLNIDGHKYHPCISEGGEDPFYLDDHREEFNNENFESSGTLSDLDKFSIRCHQVLVDRAKKLSLEPLEKLKSIPNSTLEGFCRVAENFIADTSYNDKFLYGKLKEDALEVTADQSQENPQKWKADKDSLIKKTDELVSVFIARNSKKNYYLLDNNIINGLYFDLWHGQKYQVVITACTGDAAQDIVLPLSLSCTKAVFLIGKDQKHEKERIQRFFTDRETVSDKTIADNKEYLLPHTECVFIDVDLLSKEDILNAINVNIEDGYNVADKVVLNYSNFITGSVASAFGDIASEYPSIAQLSFDSGIIRDCRSSRNISCGIHRCLTVEEYLELSGAKLDNIYDTPYVPAEFDDLCRIFKEYSSIKSYKKKKNIVSYCVWSSLSADFLNGISQNTKMYSFFGKNIMDAVAEDDSKDGSKSTKQIEGLKISSEVFRSFHVRKLLEILQHSHIISNLKIHPEKDDIQTDQFEVSFYSPDQSIRYCFRALSIWDDNNAQPDQYLIVFSGYGDNREVIRYLDTKARANTGTKENPKYHRLFQEEENPWVKSDKVLFMRELYEAHIITDVENIKFLNQPLAPDGNPIYALSDFKFANVHLKQLFQTGGKIFELILYKQISELGIFSNVKIGVRITWDDSHSGNYYKKIVQQMESVGCAEFNRAKEKVRGMGDGRTSNEIDVVLMADMRPIFISCKTGTGIEKEWLYEISSISSYFHAKPVLAVSFDLNEQKKVTREGEKKIKTGLKSGILRAKAMGISVFGSETIYDVDRFKECMKTIARGEIFMGHME